MAPAQHAEVLGCLRSAREEGARLALGGSASTAAECGNGWSVEPTVFTGVRNDMHIAQEEVFGSVSRSSPSPTRTKPSPSPTTAVTAWAQGCERPTSARLPHGGARPLRHRRGHPLSRRQPSGALWWC
ncbi:aldehyde dehydrogenase family protein [Streptomyces cellulosae]